MAQDKIEFRISPDEKEEILAAIKASGLNNANWLRKMCGLEEKQQGKRYDIIKYMNTLYAKSKTWAGKDGVFVLSYERRKETKLTKVNVSAAIVKLVEQGYWEAVGDLKDLTFKIVAKNKKGGAK